MSEPESSAGPLMLAAQGSFFVGGRDVRSDLLSTVPLYAPSGTVMVDQVYVRFQLPAGTARLPPLVLVHGCCLTGQTWETTPDGRRGWDEVFLRRGHAVYTVDQAWRGRSAASLVAVTAAKAGGGGPLPTVFSAGREDAWTVFRFGPAYPEPFPGLAFPVDAAPELWKSMVPDWFCDLPTPNPTVPALSALVRRLGGAVLVGHSQAGIYPFEAAMAGRDGLAAIVALEPASLPAPDGDMAPFAGLPILIVFGDFVDRSPRWAPRLASARAFAAAANAAGGRAEVLLLPEVGIHGNSHMMMQDANSHTVADLLAGWIERCGTAGT